MLIVANRSSIGLMVGGMLDAPWNAPVYRNRHGRGMRTPMFGIRMPHYRTRTGMFDDMVAAQAQRLGQAWPELIRPLQFAVEDVPPSDPAPWEDATSMLSRSFPASHGIPARVVLYRLPIQTGTRNRIDLQFVIRDELVMRVAELYGRRPEELDPNWGM